MNDNNTALKPSHLWRVKKHWSLVLMLLVLPLTVAMAEPNKNSTTDHSKFKQLQGPFKSAEEVTKACLTCHTEAAKQVMDTRHWTWEYKNPKDGKTIGKKTMLNGFCIGDKSNQAFCNGCHVGYGWKDDHFDFKAQEKVDCLVCHNKGGYVKPLGNAGYPRMEREESPVGSGKFLEPVDLAKVAQTIGKTSTKTCGSCHYAGGGGDGVKHGDLDSSLDKAPKDLDVHMASKEAGGQGFTCATCHKSEGHKIAGSRISMTASDPHGAMIRGAAMGSRNPATCQSCHGDKPHKQSLLRVNLLNAHTDKLACQSCHIPAFARGGIATKMQWDWSKAGENTGYGKPVTRKDAHGHVVYDGRKGSFVYGENVTPEYLWFNGETTWLTQDDKIDPSKTVAINTYYGDPNDGKSRIWPIKRFKGKQPYDLEYNTLLVPHTAIPDDTALWYNFDWQKALTTGAQATGKPYSGKYGFVNTEMLWPITHMVAPKDKAVSCVQCHSNANGKSDAANHGDNPEVRGRLASITHGVYMPGRSQDHLKWLDILGWLGVVGAIAFVIVHTIGRVMTRKTHQKSSD